MLKWFKKLTERFFSEEIEEDNQEEHLKEEKMEMKKQTDPKERPAFRFPIITDAEIYGWEDDGFIEEIKQSDKRSTDNTSSNDFDSVPLYQNERWPGTKNQRNVQDRQASLKATEERVLSEKRSSVLEKEEKNNQIKSDLSTIQNNMRTQRFTPSQVPSPIFGFTQPKTSNHKSIEIKTNEEVETAIHHVENELSENFTTDVKQKSEEQINYEEFAEHPEVVETTTEENTNQSSEESELETETSIKEPEEHNFDMDAELDDTIEETEVHEEAVIVEEQPDEKELIPAEESALVQEEQVATITEQEAVCDSDGETEKPAKEKNTEAREKPNDEKIVPFNVLMLKSDKRKLKTRQLANEIADEMKAKKKTAPLQEEEEPVREKVEEAAPVIEENNASEGEAEIKETAEHEENQSLAHYAFPSLDYLVPPEEEVEDTEWLASQSEKLEESLSHFGVQANVIDAVQGPTVTRFEFTVGQGTKVSRVRNLTDDLKLALAARDIRIEAPIPGKSSIGIEIPNRQARAVRISEVIQTEDFQQSKSPLEAVLGLGLTGEPVTLDLRKMPHGMIAGATGSGKSVCINSILVSLLYKASPTDLQMMLIDPKMVELAPFNGVPHLISPVITDVKAATAALKWAVAEMERRYELLAHAGVRDIERYNQQAVENREFSSKMPYLLIVIDELADLMMMAPADVEVSISRIAQKARACGIHLIIATQRPSVDVITGIIKANIPTRIAFSVSSQVDSRTMIDTNGAERLLGKGDMLYVGNGESMPVRLQGTFVTDDEIERIIEHVQREASPTYLFGQDELLQSATEDEEDPLFTAVCEFIYKQNSASTSMLQRNFSIGYNRAAKLMDRLEELSFISPQQGSRARDVYLTEADLNKLTETIL